MPQSPVVHVTSHPHDVEQFTVPHAFVSVQRTSHAPGPHVIVPHAAGAVHWIVQSAACVQSIVPHASHVMSQLIPLGHVTPPVGESIVHDGGVVEKSHDVHCDGHVVTCSTQ